MHTHIITSLVIIILSSIPLSEVNASDSKWEMGIKANVSSAGGEPSNDILGGGITARYHLDDGWFLHASLDFSQADFERPAKILGLQQDSSVSTIDATYDATMVSFYGGREYGLKREKFNYFWLAGIGINTVDVDDVTGPLQGGGTFDISTDVDTETIISLKAGILQNLSTTWVVNYVLGIDRHLTEWTLTDRVSATTATIDDYTTVGFSIELSRRF